MIRLEKSKRNRTGSRIEFAVTFLTVFDDDLGAWRRANPELTVERPESMRLRAAATARPRL
ncbi:hypothetical protein ACH4ZU_08920 [Streptomyces sp. NPDC020472]|uniref:hypothetical protein n=1 Tax=Streptomyces sp. NPDC020472 TaxID=3365075 RepID=UPI00379B3E89